MKLITETYYEPLSLLNEADESGKKHLHIQGPFAVAEVTNKNGRKYPQELMESVIKKFDTDYITPRRALGEMSHPSRLSIDFERATHLITEMKQDKNVWIGKAKVLKTPMGKILEGLLESGVNIGVSTRGAGTIIESGGVKTVGNDFMMTAVDVVSDPSALYISSDGSMQGAFVNGISEGVDFTMTDKGAFIQETITQKIKQDYDKKQLTESRKIELFSLFIKEIKGC